MALNPGKYRFPAVLYSSATHDDFGGTDLTRSKVRDMWVAVKALQGSESVDGAQVVSSNAFVLHTPYTPGPLDTSMVIVTDRGEYEITSVVNVDERDQEYEIAAVRTKRPD